MRGGTCGHPAAGKGGLQIPPPNPCGVPAPPELYLESVMWSGYRKGRSELHFALSSQHMRYLAEGFRAMVGEERSARYQGEHVPGRPRSRCLASFGAAAARFV